MNKDLEDEDERYPTLAGYMLRHLGGMPEEGEAIPAFQHCGDGRPCHRQAAR